MLSRRVIQHRLKIGVNDLATIDRVGGVIKDMIAQRMGEMGGDWLNHIAPTIAAYNQLDHNALFQNAPVEVKEDVDLRFRLRMENADKHAENVKQAQTRATILEDKGAYITLLQPLALNRRKGIPNWSTDVHTVAQVEAGW